MTPGRLTHVTNEAMWSILDRGAISDFGHDLLGSGGAETTLRPGDDDVGTPGPCRVWGGGEEDRGHLPSGIGQARCVKGGDGRVLGAVPKVPQPEMRPMGWVPQL